MSSASPTAPAPTSSPERRTRAKGSPLRRLLVALLLVGGAVGLAAAAWAKWGTKGVDVYSGPRWTIGKEKLLLSIVERGALESAENSEIVCRVKAFGRGASASTTIKWLIEDGTQVQKGDKLVELDDAGLQEQLKDQVNKVNQAKASWIQAEQNFLITESQNFSEIESAKTALILAEIEMKKFLGERIAPKVAVISDRESLQKFLEKELDVLFRAELSSLLNVKTVSEVLQTLNDIEGRIEIARSDREMWFDRASWSQRMVKKGYLSRSQADADRSRLDSSEFTLKKTQGELDIFRRYTIEQKVTELWSKIKEAERALERVATQARSKIVQSTADRDSKKAVFLQEDDKRQDIETEISHCVIYSPQDGMVVYYVPESSRMSFGSSSQMGLIAQGEPVREGQKMMRIPNLNRMLVNVRVHEAMVSRVRGEVTRPTGFSNAVQASIVHNLPPLAAAATHGAFFHQIRDGFKDRDHVTVDRGQKAFVRVESYAAKIFPGHVRSVATVASQADYYSSDIKVYTTLVAVDGYVENLKPGMSAEVTIVADETPDEVLTVPLQSVLGSVGMGPKRKVYVIGPDGRPEQKDIVVGRSNDKMAEVISGLEEKDVVVLNPRSLVGEKSDLKPGTPGQRRGGGVDVEDGKSKKSGKKSSGPPATGAPPATNGGAAPRVDADRKAPALDALPPAKKA